MAVLRDRALWIWRAAILGATFLLVLAVSLIIVASALKLPARAANRSTAKAPALGRTGSAVASAAIPAVTVSTPPAPPRAAAPAPPPPAPAPPPAPPAPQTDAAGTVWLCRPGLANNPCTQSLAATSVAANGTKTPVNPRPTANAAKVDCFYAYPTVSTQGTQNANLSVDPPETAIAVTQASRFSQVCQVWAPIYRQRTLALFPDGSFDPNAAAEVAYESLSSAWNDYLTHFNNGRPVVLIGHSQGAIVLARLIGAQVDPNPAVRKRVVSALLIGGNAGGFPNMGACHSGHQTGCVIAYSSYYEEPPGDSVFGRLGGLCTNPANLGGGSGALDAYLRVNGAWVEYLGLYSASCESRDGATWLQVNVTPGDPRPRLPENLGPAWGLHQNGDVNLALGNLIYDVATEEEGLG